MVYRYILTDAYAYRPVPDMEGSKEQDVFYRMLKLAPNGTILEQRFWDTYSFLGTEGVRTQAICRCV